MSTPIKILLLLLAWLLYTVFAYRGCKEELCLHCGDGTAGVVAPPAGPEESITRYPIDFQWDNAEAFKNDGADAELKALAAGLQNNNNVLEVTGYYYEGEKAPPGFDNMGFARAARLKDMLAAAGVPADRIQTRARALQATLKTDDGQNLIQGFKRANNILTQAEAKDGVEYSFGADPKFAETPEELALFQALDAAEAAMGVGRQHQYPQLRSGPVARHRLEAHAAPRTSMSGQRCARTYRDRSRA